MHNELIPDEQRIFGWIEEVFRHGVRRPGYPADRWAEQWLQEQFRALGLERVRAEPVELPYWEPEAWSLRVTDAAGAEHEIDCFPLPHTAPVDELEAPLVAFDAERPERVRGNVALYDVPLTRVPQTLFAERATWAYDPEGTYPGNVHILPFGREIQEVMEPATRAGAAAFIGTLSGYPGDSNRYYVPYDAHDRPLPGVWVNGRDGERLRAMLAQGAVRVWLRVASKREPITSYNIVGELPGADDETVIVGSHHDGPWASAVEDGSGIALVLAQAAYWSRVSRTERPHRMLFLLNAGHMAGGAGVVRFVDQHRSELGRVVLEVHLEHTANEFSDIGGELRPTGHPESRWWFTSRIGRLEAAVRQAIGSERLGRSMMLRPDFFGPRPTTDGGEFHLAGVPIVNFLTAPFYLFDEMDTLDKIHRPSLEPVTRAAIRIIESTRGVSAAAMRAGVIDEESREPLQPA